MRREKLSGTEMKEYQAGKNDPMKSPKRAEQSRRSVTKHERSVSKASAGLNAAFRTKFQSRVAEDLAFNCAEVYAELLILRRLLERAIAKSKISARDLNELQTMLTIHWLYHLGEIKKIFRKAPGMRLKEPFLRAKQLENMCDVLEREGK